MGRPATARRRAGGIAWIVAAVYFVVQPVVAIRWTGANGGYRWGADYISDLGLTGCTPAACSPWHDLMNAGFAITGAVVVLGVVLLWPARPTGKPTAVGAVLVALGGVGTVVVGLVPADVSVAAHGLAAAVHIPSQAVGLLLCGIGLVRQQRGLGLWTLLCAIAALVGTVLFLGGLSGPLGVGGAERLADYPFVAWIVVTGLAAAVAGRRHGRSG